MVINIPDLVYVASVLAALVAIVTYAAKAHNWFLKQEKQDEEIAFIKQEIAAIKAEQKIMCSAMYSTLDGLEQLGANHIVPESKKKLGDYLNEAAHQ